MSLLCDDKAEVVGLSKIKKRRWGGILYKQRRYSVDLIKYELKVELLIA